MRAACVRPCSSARSSPPRARSRASPTSRPRPRAATSSCTASRRGGSVLGRALCTLLLTSGAAFAGEVEDAMRRARTALAQGEADGAVRELERARDLAPRRADLAYQLARAH